MHTVCLTLFWISNSISSFSHQNRGMCGVTPIFQMRAKCSQPHHL